MTDANANEPKPTARSIGSATISFGLISIPCKLYTTEQTVDEISFNMLHDADHAQLKQKYVCSKCSQEVDKEHTCKGYEHAKGQWVIFAPEELEALKAVATETIALDSFVLTDAVDPLYIEKTYYLGPDKGCERPYSLLARVMDRRSVVAIGQWSARGKEHVVAVRPYQSGLAIHVLRYEREVKPWSAVPAHPTVQLTASEIALGEQLVEQMERAELDMSQYTDRVHERIKALIQQKVDTGAIVAAPAAGEAAPPAPIDLLESLKASIDVAPPKRFNRPKVKPTTNRKLFNRTAKTKAKRKRAA